MMEYSYSADVCKEHALEVCDVVFKALYDQNAVERAVDNEHAHGKIMKRYMRTKGESKGVSNAMDHVTQAMYTGEDFERRVNALYEAALGQVSAALELAVVARMLYEQSMLYPAGKTPMEALAEAENDEEENA